MGFSFQTAINSRLGVGLALGLGRAVPPRLGYSLARLIADRIASRRSLGLVQAARANQWVVSGGQISGLQLDCAVLDTFRNTARCLYDLYHTQGDLAAMQSLIAFNPTAEEMIERTRAGREGIVIVGVHMSNFDLVMQAAGLRGLGAQVISTAQPSGGYRLQNSLRRQNGLDITPASMAALRQAVQRLQSGGSVLTGVDRPLPEAKYHPVFFGRPACLPVHHIYLALKAEAPVYVFAAILEPSGIYRISAVGPIDMRPFNDHHTALKYNAEAVLEVAEGFIRQAPQQWSMFYQVWPEVLQEMTDRRVN